MTHDNAEQRLRHIFSTVLAVAPDQIDDALSPATCSRWDSLNQIHLVNSIEEEFGVSLDFESQMNMTSFGKARQILANVLG